MDEKPESAAAGTDLAAALRRARIENAERADAVAELREIELGRLALLESALQKVVRQAPPGVDLFDLTLSRGDRPRVFLDMVAFVEMARDRRTYRFFQDTVYGRVAIAESPKIETIVAACTNYVARRLVERERALAADAPALDADAVDMAPPPPAAKAGVVRKLIGALAAFLAALGAATLVSALMFVAWLAWTRQLGVLGALWSVLRAG